MENEKSVKDNTENQQLIDFLLTYHGSYSAISRLCGYSSTHITNIYTGSDNASRTAFTLMLRQLCIETVLTHAKSGTLVREKSLGVIVIKHDENGDIREMIRQVLREEIG